jgi:hypothetical protein
MSVTLTNELLDKGMEVKVSACVRLLTKGVWVEVLTEELFMCFGRF